MKKFGFLTAVLLLASCAQVPSRDQFASENATEDADAALGNADAGTDASADADVNSQDVGTDAADTFDTADALPDATDSDADASVDVGADADVVEIDAVDVQDAAVAEVDVVAGTDAAADGGADGDMPSDTTDAAEDVADADVVATPVDVTQADAVADAIDAETGSDVAAFDDADAAVDVTAVTCTVSGCDDGNVCTTDSCDTNNACLHTANAVPCPDDGVTCTSDTCASGACIHTIQAGAGLIGATCWSGGDWDAATPCLLCSPSKSKETWTLGTSTCFIGGTCVSSGATQSAGCQVCLPGTATNAWSDVSGSCEDGDACTVGDACAGGACSPGSAKVCAASDQCHSVGTCSGGTCSNPNKNDGAGCEDGNPCTDGDVCSAGACKPGGQKVCSDANPCVVGSCNPGVAGGCVFTNNDLAACTSSSPACPVGQCAGGQCFAQPNNTCNDGSACTTGDKCDSAGNCAGSVVNCVDGFPCTTDTCNTSTGCVHTPDNTACDDGIACTTDSCSASSGCSHVAVNSACDDNTSCTTDTCNATTGCVHLSDGKTCNDVNVCTTDVCTSGNGATGCSHSNIGGNCDDGLACTTSDSCTAGVCAGVAIDCSSLNGQCAIGYCDGGTCHKTSVANYTLCNADGNGCTQNDFCSGGVCVLGTAIDCSSACAGGSCQSTSATTFTCPGVAKPDGSSCNDGNACTGPGTGDSCKGGICVGGAPLDCNDQNICTDDACSPVAGCTITMKTCNDANPCTVDSCDSSLGCQHEAVNGGLCDDGNDCTINGVCDLGICKSQKLNCDDNLPCTTDLCSGGGCVHPTRTCDDGNPCTSDLCNSVSGVCANTVMSDNTACDDGNSCTTSDVCTSGTCGGTAIVCTASDQCHNVGTCSGGSCSNPAKTDGAGCTDGKTCTTDACVGGSCVGTPVNANCSDGLPCTTDTCTPAGGNAITGCLFTNDNTNTCTDSRTCTSDACLGGACVSTKINGNCDDGNGCTTDTCDPSSGSANAATGCYFTNLTNGATCSDGDACTVGEACSGGSCVGGKAKLWSGAYGGSSDQIPVGAARGPDGSYVIVGDTGNYITSYPAWAVGIDANGQQKWTQTYSNGAYGSESAVVGVADGWVFSGRTSTKGNGALDWWLVKLDLTGNKLWDRTFGTGQDDSSGALIALSDGGFLIGGSIHCCTNYDAMVVRTDSNGIATWSQSYGGSAGDDIGGLAALSDGGFAVAAETKSVDLPNGQKSAGAYDFWLLRLDSGGNLLLNQTYGGTGQDTARAVVQLDDGGFLLAGTTASTNLPGGQKSAGGNDIWLVRTDAAGTLLWSRTYGGTGDDNAAALLKRADGFIVAGSTASPNLPGGQKSAGGSDGWLFRADLNGNLNWNRTYGGTGTDSFSSVIDLGDGFALGGSTNSTDLPYGAQANGIDGWLLRTDVFGAPTCTLSGACVSKADADCEDGNSCTADSCTGGACTHTAMAVGTECNNHGFCDASQNCVAQMAPIPAGTFWMGCNSLKDTNCLSNESPQHKVTLSAYSMDLTETTVGQYKACVDAGACTAPSSQQPTSNATYPGLTNNPVNFVNWDQAQQFCKWRGAQFDLPTEAQWEMAARGRCEENGSAASDPACAQAMRTYPWGEDAPTGSYAVFSVSSTAAVGSVPAGDSPYGLHDMAGNVWEWARDWFSATFYTISPATDPYDSVSAPGRVHRGGGLDGGAVLLRASYRYSTTPSEVYFYQGFRCARSPP